MILEQSTKFSDIISSDILTVYHCSSEKDLKKSLITDKPLHCGTLYQAICRGDYKVNDDELYDVCYIYELTASLNGLYHGMYVDDGSDSDEEREKSYKPNKVLVYKNVAEGRVEDENLSIIILDHANILDIKLFKIYSGKELEESLNNY